MKKIIAAVAVICLIFAGYITFLQVQSRKPAAPANEPATVTVETPVQQEQAAEAAAKSHAPDFAAMAELYPAEQIIMNIDGRDITWQEYYYWYYYYTRQISDSLDMMAMYYGQDNSWDDDAGSEGIKYSDLPVLYVEDQLKQVETICGFAKESGIELTDDDMNSYEQILKADIESVCGENGTIEEFEAALRDMYMNIDIYKRMNETNLYYERSMTELYGTEGSNITDAEAVNYLKDNGYMSAVHILLGTIDNATGESVDEDTKNSIKATAEKLSAELQDIKDDEKRLSRMKELIDEYNEDPGMLSNPNGYTFTDGTMVSEFENAVKALKEYEVSSPVETKYGYHIIMTVPLDPDAVISGTSAATSGSVKNIIATERYVNALDEYLSTMEIKYQNDFKAPVISSYVED